MDGRADEFSTEIAHPSQLRENLHHFREIANFGAHTQKDDQAEILEVDRGEAEWKLDLLRPIIRLLHRRPREGSQDARIHGREDPQSEAQACASVGRGERQRLVGAQTRSWRMVGWQLKSPDGPRSRIELACLAGKNLVQNSFYVGDDPA